MVALPALACSEPQLIIDNDNHPDRIVTSAGICTKTPAQIGRQIWQTAVGIV